MSVDAALLRGSFDPGRCPQVVRRFYEILFERYPQVRPIFGNLHTEAQQEEKVAATLVALVQHLENADWLSLTLKPLGARHLDYGVTDEMYGWVGESLLAALAEVAGPDWTPELAAAWTAAYEAVAALMRIGAAAERSARAPG
jgi:hemoglobin-like flavoprotein